MFSSIARSIKKTGIIAFTVMAVTSGYSFKNNFNDQDWLTWTNKCLDQSYDPSADKKLKKWELTVTPTYFLRLRKTYNKNKQVYYSFNLNKLKEINYTGNTKKGILQLKALADDIIVQSYNDRKGDVDSMSAVLNIPLKNMEAERLDSLQEALDYFKAKGL
jgi:hypothetical protein